MLPLAIREAEKGHCHWLYILQMSSLPRQQFFSLHIPIMLVVSLWRRRQVRVNVLSNLGSDLLPPRLLLIVLGPFCATTLCHRRPTVLSPVTYTSTANETRSRLPGQRRAHGRLRPVYDILPVLRVGYRRRFRKVASASAACPDVLWRVGYCLGC